MKKIRRSLFETNSSSSHSIEICPTGQIDDVLESAIDDVVYLGTGEYGWGYDKLTSAYEKADYCAVRFLLEENEDALETLAAVIKDQTNLEVAFERSDIGYIDHQSMDEDIPYGYNGLFDLIFDVGSYIIIDNDNH